VLLKTPAGTTAEISIDCGAPYRKEITMKYVTRHDFELYLTRKAWEDPDFREELISDPKAVLERELNAEPLPEDVEVEVLEETPEKYYLIIPMPPEEFMGRALASREFAAISRQELEQAVGEIRLMWSF
jgi:hypothetical protein